MKNKKFRKLRILWCGEASFLKTGYAIYAKELLTKLYNTGKYKIAEMACYASFDNPKNEGAPWRFYPTLPLDEEENRAYTENPSYQFGEWRFDDVCLDFRPDVVIDIRDWWMVEYQQRSAFRGLYKWAIMPTVDSCPQQEQYLNTFMDADAVFTYSEFGTEVLEKEGFGCIKLKGMASPGADFDNLKPVVNKSLHRSNFGFMDDINIIGTIMRNQRRKLYPNLISTFRKMLDENPELQKNTFLYIHSCYPDLGWDFPGIIKSNRMGHNIVMTYKCPECDHFFPSFFKDCKTSCPKCNNSEASLPSTSFGVSTKELGHIINWFDLYVQYSICEGFGMPQVEAAACAIPILTVNYSAMESVGKKLKADFVQPKCFFWDSPTGSQRAIPDDEELKDKMLEFIKMPKSVRSKKGMDSYIGAKKNYTWENAAESWESYLDTIEPLSHEETWDSPANIRIPEQNTPEWIKNNEDFVEWAFTNILCQPEKIDTYLSMRMLRDLNYGTSTNKGGGLYYNELSNLDNNLVHAPYSTNDAMNQLMNLRNYINSYEQKREELSKSENWDGIDRPHFLDFVQPDKNHSLTAD